MPKFNLDINGINEGAAEGREAWSGEIPPTGTYSGVLKICQVGTIGANSAENAGKPRLKIGVELRGTPDKKYDGYVAFGGVNLIESGIPFVNQFLMALTDGSDAEFEKIKKAFYSGFVTDERRVNVTGIGRWNVNSPEGELPIKISLKQQPPRFVPETKTTLPPTTQIQSFLVSDNPKRPGGSVTAPEAVVEEESPVDLDLDIEDDDVDSVDRTEEVENYTEEEPMPEIVSDENEIDALLATE